MRSRDGGSGAEEDTSPATANGTRQSSTPANRFLNPQDCPRVGDDMAVVGRLAYLFALLAVGVLARQVGVLDDYRTTQLHAVSFYGTLPALVFASTYDQPLGPSSRRRWSSASGRSCSGWSR